jgi:hypothetical protein
MFSASLQNWLKGRNRIRRGAGARARRACRFRPGGETLEARELLATTLVTPHGPAPGGAPVQINNVQVVPIFWGWPNPSILTSPLQKAQWAAARLSIMNFLSQLTSTGNPWMNGLSQYQVGLGKPVTLSTSDFFPSTALPTPQKGSAA